MKTVLALLIAVLVAAPSYVAAATYQYTSNTGVVKTVEADSYIGAFFLIPDIGLGSQVVEVGAPVQQATIAPVIDTPASLNLKAMSKTELRQLRSAIEDELASRESNDISTGNPDDQSSAGDGADNTEAEYEATLANAREVVNQAQSRVISAGYPGSSNKFINKAIGYLNEIDEYAKDNSSLGGVIWMAEEAERYAGLALKER